MDLLVIVGDHGDLWQSFPLVALGPLGMILFMDARMAIRDRIAFAAAACPVEDRGNVEVFRLPITIDCDQGLHDWEPVERAGFQVAATCQACGQVEPYPHPLPLAQSRLAMAN